MSDHVLRLDDVGIALVERALQDRIGLLRLMTDALLETASRKEADLIAHYTAVVQRHRPGQCDCRTHPTLGGSHT